MLDTLDEHVRKRQLELSSYVLGRKTIYLDVNFWLILRKVELGELADSTSKEYHELAINLADKELCIFPISEDTFLEVLKQSDPKTLSKTISIIDRLSKGISIISYDERLRLEILHYMRNILGQSTYHVNQLIWTKLAYTMGHYYPVHKNLDKNVESLLQKSFFDHMWQISLTDMLQLIGDNSGLENIPRLPDSSAVLTTGKFAHRHENSTFKKMFLSELAGMLDTYYPLLQETILYFYVKETGSAPTEEEVENSKNDKWVANMVYNLFRLNKITTELPSYRIISGLYAAVRWDKQQKFQQNDMHDFRHASAALPYCDYFFCEKRLSHLLTQKMLSYDKLYGCKVERDVAAAAELLNRLRRE